MHDLPPARHKGAQPRRNRVGMPTAAFQQKTVLATTGWRIGMIWVCPIFVPKNLVQLLSSILLVVVVAVYDYDMLFTNVINKNKFWHVWPLFISISFSFLWSAMKYYYGKTMLPPLIDKTPKKIMDYMEVWNEYFLFNNTFRRIFMDVL